jgi:hypothetical protein
MQTNETIKPLSTAQVLAYNDFCAHCVRAGMNKIRAIQALRSAHAGITGKAMSLRVAKDVVDHGYQVRTNQIVMEELPRALRGQFTSQIISLATQRDFLFRLGLEAHL